MVIPPCAMATGDRRTLPPATMVPVRSLMTTRACGIGCTSSSVSLAIIATVEPRAFTWIEPPSSAVAVPRPKDFSTASTMR
jgi:hypothetical protein